MPRYSQKRPPASHTSSIQFDAGVSGRKPTAAKSAGTLGKWGVTSFTSIRSSIVNGTHDGSTDGRVASPPAPPVDAFSFESNTPGAAPARKVKKFFKSRNAPAAAGLIDARRPPPVVRPPPPRPVHLQNVHSPAEEKTEEPESKRFFSSPAMPQPLRDTTTNRANSLSPREPPAAPQAPRMPPLKLRISRDKDTGDLTAVSGTPDEGGGGGRRRHQPPPAAPQPPKAPRYKSPPPPARSPSPAASPQPADPPAEDGGGRGVRRTRRAAALEARERVAKTVRYGEEEEDEFVPSLVPVRGRRAPRRRSSASEPPATEPQQPVVLPVANGASAAAGCPVEGRDEVPAPAAEEEPAEPTPASAPSSPAQAVTSQERGSDADSGEVVAEAGHDADAVAVAARMPGLTRAPTLVSPAARPSLAPAPDPTPVQTPQSAAESAVPPETEPTTDLTPADPPAQTPTSPPASGPAEPELQPSEEQPSGAAPSGDQEPVNLSTRRPAVDLERQLSCLFGEPLPPTHVTSVEPEPTSKVYRKGIKDLGRYQRTQESAADSPQALHPDLESRLELLEAGRPLPDAAGGPSQDSDPPPTLARANTDPVMPHKTRSATAAAAAAAAAGAASGAAGGKVAPAEPKKGSIFKTRTGGRSARARYNHRWTDDKDEPAPRAAAAPAQNSDAASGTSALDFPDAPSASGSDPVSGRLTRVSTWHGADPNSSQQPVTSVKVDRRAKEYYTVIQNVKKAYQIQESGEFQEYNDDIDYIMDALQPTNSVSTRCLSATGLASKCMVPAFRMHLRAHGTVTRFFAALSDAPSDPCLSLCTSAVMFILSEDQLNMDLDKSSLELMLSLLDSDVTSSAAESDESNVELRKNRAKVRELCAQLQRQGQAKQLQLDNITASHLSMETLLSLTSQRAGAWFKEELRELGGLDRLLGTVSESLRSLQLPRRLRHQKDVIARINRCLRVVENVTSRNEDNQRYLLRAGGGEALATLSQLFELAETELADCRPADFQASDGAARVLLEMTDTLMKVLVNLSSTLSGRPAPAACGAPGASGGAQLGDQPGLLGALLHSVLRLPERLPEERQFDVLLLAMYLLMNLAEAGGDNRRRIAAAPAPPREGQITDVPSAGSALTELLHMFYRLVRLASEVESHTDRILDGPPPVATPGGQDAGEVTATALIQKAGHHMEKTVIAAYIGVLVGHLAMDNPEYEAAVRAHLHNRRFTDVIDVLRKLLSFMDLTNTGRPETLHEMRTMRRVMEFMSRADQAAPDAAAAPASVAPSAAEELGVLDMSL